MRRVVGGVVAMLVAGGCASHSRPEAKLDESGLARLNEQQMEPVDRARIDEGRARDALARARASEADARARADVSKSEGEVARAQYKRAVAEHDLLKKQYADRDAMARADEEINSAKLRIEASDLKTQYLTTLIGVAEADRRVAEAHVDTALALTEQAKLRAMKAANVPQADSVNAGSVDARVAHAQEFEAQLRSQAAGTRTHATELYNRWQSADARVRTLQQPQSDVPAPTAPAEPTK